MKTSKFKKRFTLKNEIAHCTLGEVGLPLEGSKENF